MILEASHLVHGFQTQSGPLEILRDINLNLRPGQSLAIMGPSGCGKSTLVAALGGLLRPNQGTVSILGQNLWGFRGDDLVKFRARNIGIIFQQFHLLPFLSALENVSLPADLQGLNHSFDRAQQALALMDLSSRADHLPTQLSRGECQRVAIARALSLNPKLILADEPTASLDQANALKIASMLVESTKVLEAALLIVTHDERIAGLCQSTLHFVDGQLREVR